MYPSIISENRIGRFLINDYVITNMPNTAAILLSGMVIIRAEFLYQKNGIEYLAYSSLFSPANEACVAPMYELKFNGNHGVVAEEVPY